MSISVFKNHIGEWVAAVILGFMEILALSLYYRDSLGFWLKNAGNVLLFAGLWILATVLLYLFFRLIGLLCRPRLVIGKRTEGKHPFLFSALVLTACYLPWIISFYPGSAIYDMMYQTVQADGFMAINAHHPIFATYVIGLCSKIGLALTGRLNLGIFLYILLQSAVCIFSFAYMYSYMTKLGVSRPFRLFVLGFLAITPLWGGAMQCGTKDTLFTGLFVFFIVLSSRLLLEGSRSFRSRHWIFYGVLILLLCLYRNAIWIILAASILVFVIALRNDKKARIRLVLFSLAALLLAGAFETVTKQIYHTKTETGEILTIPFQQTARFVRDHPEEISEEEQDVIEKTFVLEDFRQLGELYYPMSSDPVKARYHWWASDEEKTVLGDYFNVWFSMLKKRPGTYLEATLSGTYGYYAITPVIKNQKGGAGTTVQFYPDTLAVQSVIDASSGTLSEDLIPESPESLKGAQQALSGWYYFWQKMPVLGLFFKCGFYFLILLAVTIRYGKRKNKLILLTIPAFLLILMAIASPVNEHIRYILPAAAALPMIISAAGAEEIKKEK